MLFVDVSALHFEGLKATVYAYCTLAAGLLGILGYIFAAFASDHELRTGATLKLTSILGPILCAAVGLGFVLALKFTSSIGLRETLDRLALGMPLLGVGGWLAAHIAGIHDLEPVDPTSATEASFPEPGIVLLARERAEKARAFKDRASVLTPSQKVRASEQGG